MRFNNTFVSLGLVGVLSSGIGCGEVKKVEVEKGYETIKGIPLVVESYPATHSINSKLIVYVKNKDPDSKMVKCVYDGTSSGSSNSTNSDRTLSAKAIINYKINNRDEDRFIELDVSDKEELLSNDKKKIECYKLRKIRAKGFDEVDFYK